ncbi:MAG: 4Fe-4S binding protein [archaeon]|nr:4Fe-4S binding protein [archaeon]
MECKYKIEFEEGAAQESVTYILVSEFSLKPNVLKAEIDGDGSGKMLISLKGEEDDIVEGMEKLKSMGFKVTEFEGHITHDMDRCFSCGACVSVCPTRSIYHDKGTWIVKINTGTCIGCGSCLGACSVKAINLVI